MKDKRTSKRVSSGRGRPGARLVATGPMGTIHSTFEDDDRRSGEDEQLKLAGFRVGQGMYAIDIMRIKEVIQAAPYPIRQVPYAPSIVEGVIQLRGVVIPVIDLRKRFNCFNPEADQRLNKLIIVSVRGRIIGLKVDCILGELRIPAKALRPAPSMLRPSENQPTDFFAGVCRIDNEMVFVLTLETLLDPSVGSSGSMRTGADVERGSSEPVEQRPELQLAPKPAPKLEVSKA